MPVFLVALVGLIWDVARAVLPSIVGKIMITLGLSVAVTKFVLPDALGYVQSHMGGMPGTVIALFGYLNVDKFISLVLSAAVARAAGKAVLSARVPGAAP